MTILLLFFTFLLICETTFSNEADSSIALSRLSMINTFELSSYDVSERIYNVSTDAELQDAIATGESATIIIFADIQISETLTIHNTRKIVFESAPGERFTLSGSGSRHLMDLTGATHILIKNLILADFKSEKKYYAGAIDAFGRNVTLVVVDSQFQSNNQGTQKIDELGGAVGCRGAICEFYGVKFNNLTAMHGGAVYLTDSSKASFVDVVFKGTKSTYYGGAVFADDHSRITFLKATFISSSASDSNGYGGAIRLDSGSRALFTESIFIDCNAAHGGAIYQEGEGTKSSFFNSSFTSCIANIYGGGALYLIDGAEARFVEVSFVSCKSYNSGGSGKGSGGAVSVRDGSSAFFEKSSFSFCYAETNGGAIRNVDGSKTVFVQGKVVGATSTEPACE